MENNWFKEVGNPGQITLKLLLRSTSVLLSERTSLPNFVFECVLAYFTSTLCQKHLTQHIVTTASFHY